MHQYLALMQNILDHGYKKKIARLLARSQYAVSDAL